MCEYWSDLYSALYTERRTLSLICLIWNFPKDIRNLHVKTAAWPPWPSLCVPHLPAPHLPTPAPALRMCWLNWKGGGHITRLGSLSVFQLICFYKIFLFHNGMIFGILKVVPFFTSHNIKEENKWQGFCLLSLALHSSLKFLANQKVRRQTEPEPGNNNTLLMHKFHSPIKMPLLEGPGKSVL